MIKSILVPVNGDRSNLPVLSAALTVARNFAAHIDALHVGVDPVDTAVAMTTEAPGGMLIAGLVDQLEKDAREHAAKAKRLFAQFCAREKLPEVSNPEESASDLVTAQWHTERGEEPGWVSNYGMASDLIVAGRGENGGSAFRAVLEAALLQSGRPLLVPAHGSRHLELHGTVAIAWKPTAQAAHAVGAAMPFIQQAKKIMIMTVEENTGTNSAEHLARNLAWHGRAVEIETLRPHGREPVETLLAAAGKGADLLVMGGYGHSRVRELVLGGFTRRVLTDAPLPVLLAH